MNTINQRVSVVRRVWGWLTEQELIAPHTWYALKSVRALQAGRSKARVTSRIAPVGDYWIEKTCEFLPPSLRAMIQLQLLTGMRPGELCALRLCDIDRSGRIWVYQPKHHKMSHRNLARRIQIGPRGQELLAPFLGRDLAQHVFRPEQAMQERQDARVAIYRPPEDGYDYRVTASYTARRRAVKSRKDLQPYWSVGAYRLAIKRAAHAAGAPHWHPHQLRHTAASQVRAQWGLDASQLLLGHRHADTTEVYAEADLRRLEAIVLLRG